MPEQNNSINFTMNTATNAYMAQFKLQESSQKQHTQHTTSAVEVACSGGEREGFEQQFPSLRSGKQKEVTIATWPSPNVVQLNNA